MRVLWALVLLLPIAGCEESGRVVDPFSVEASTSSGAILVSATDDDLPVITLAVDVLSPITVIDSYRPPMELPKPQRRLSDITLFGQDAQGTATIPRVRFPNSAIFDLHPCQVSNAESPEPCRVGSEESSSTIHGVLGADIIETTSLRFDFPNRSLRFFPDAAGTVSERTQGCDAVFESPYSGGGTLIFQGSEIRYDSNRPTMGICAHNAAIPEPEASDLPIGTDLQMAISTAIGPTLLTQSAYERYAANAPEGTVPPLLDLAASRLHLISGPIAVLLGEIPYIALVGEVGDDSDGRGPCRELYANARMRTAGGCADPTVDCPCPDEEESCKAAAAIELNRSIQVAIVDDALPLLQALREELRPSVPELDGILGVEALSELRVEFDYPNNRILMRCLLPEHCITRPQVRSQSTLPVLDSCRAKEEAARVAGSPDAGGIP